MLATEEGDVIESTVETHTTAVDPAMSEMREDQPEIGDKCEGEEVANKEDAANRTIISPSRGLSPGKKMLWRQERETCEAGMEKEEAKKESDSREDGATGNDNHLMDNLVDYLERLAMLCEERCTPSRENEHYKQLGEDEREEKAAAMEEGECLAAHHGAASIASQKPCPGQDHSNDGPMTAGEISRLHRELLRARDVEAGLGLHRCPPDALLALVPYLLMHMKVGRTLNMVREASAVHEGGGDAQAWVGSTDQGGKCLQQALVSLEAAGTALLVMTAPEIDRRLITQELVEEVVGLLKHHVTAHVLPAVDPQARGAIVGCGRPEGRGEEDEEGQEEEENEEEEEEEGEVAGGRNDGRTEEEDEMGEGAEGGNGGGEAGHSKGKRGTGSSKKDGSKGRGQGGKGSRKPGGKRRRRSSLGVSFEERAYLRPLLRQLVRLLPKVQEAVDLVEALILSIRVDDPVLLALGPLCASILAVDPGAGGGGLGPAQTLALLQPIQTSSISLLQSIFGRYEKHRSLILEDILGLYSKLPGGKRPIRAFRLHYRAATLGTEGQSIQMTSALVILLVQAVVVRPQALLEGRGKGGKEGGTEEREETWIFDGTGDGQDAGGLEGEAGILAVAHQFAGAFLDRCARKEGGTEFRQLLQHLVDDLLLAFLLPEWPGAELLLQALCTRLLRDLYHQQGRQQGGREAGKTDSIYFLQCLDLLGRMLSKLRELWVVMEGSEGLGVGKDDGVAGGGEDAGRVVSEAVEKELSKAVIEEETSREEGVRVTEWFRRVMQDKMDKAGARNTLGRGLGLSLELEHERSEKLEEEGKEGRGQNGQERDEKQSLEADTRADGMKGRVAGEKGRKRKRGGSPGVTGSKTEAVSGKEGGKCGRPSQQESKATQAQGDGIEEGVEAEGTRVEVEMEEDAEEELAEEGALSSSTLTDLDVTRQLILNYLTHKARRGESWLKFSRHCFLSRWVAESADASPSALTLEGEEDGQNDLVSGHARMPAGEERRHPSYWCFLASQWEMPPAAVVHGEADLYHVLPTEAVVHLNHALAVSRPLLQSLGLLLFRLLALLGQGQAAWRARVMKAFGNILESDPLLMLDAQVKQAVVDRFQDEATSVRQATVELVGKYVLQQPSLFDSYYQPLLERIVDKGVSVRKTAVKLLGEFLQRCPTHPLRTEICRRLVGRASMVKEEDTVKDLVQDSFQAMWFSVGVSSEASAGEGGKEDEVEGDGSDGHVADEEIGWKLKKLSEEERLTAVGLQMVEVIAGVANTDWLVALLTGLLFGPNEGGQGKKERGRQRKVVAQQCGRVVEVLVNLLLELDEGNQPPLGSKLPELATPAKQLLAVIATLHVFSRADPRFLLPHVDTLLPYLKGENHLEAAEEAALCCKVAQMVGLVLPHLSHPDRAVYAQVGRDLVLITYQFGAATIHAAVQCLANLCICVQGGDPGLILGLANTFYRVLLKFREKPSFAPQEADYTTRSSTHRALVVLGCVCRYYPGFFPPSGAAEGALPLAMLDEPLAEELTCENAFVMSYRLLSLYLTKDLSTETKAVQALCLLFTGCMPLMLTAQRDHVVGRMLTPRGGVARAPVRLQALKSLREVLLAEETRVESGAARARMMQAGVSVRQRVKGDQDAEASIVGGVIQEHLDSIKHLLFDRDDQLRTAALGILSVLHRQGLVNPLQTLPALVALQADPFSAIRAHAYRQLLIEHEKHPEFLPARILEGVSLSYTFQRRILSGRARGGTGELISAVVSSGGGEGGWEGRQSFLGPVYSTCLRQNRKHRYSFLRNLLALFEEKTARDVHAKANRQMLQKQQESQQQEPHPHRHGNTARHTSIGVPTAAADPKGQKGSLDPHFLAYVAQLLAYLPFDVQEEPLFLVHSISRTVSLQGLTLLGEMKALLTALGKDRKGKAVGNAAWKGATTLGCCDEDEDDDYGGMDEVKNGEGARGTSGYLGVSVPTGSPSRATMLAQLKDKAGTAMSLCLLLHLKHWLKNVYVLSDERCQEVRSLGGQGGGMAGGNAKTERPLSKPEGLPDLPLPAHLLASYPTSVAHGREGEKEEEEEVLAVLEGQYREFALLVRQDPSDFVLTQAPPRGGGGRGGRGGEGGGRRGARGGGRRGNSMGNAGGGKTGGRRQGRGGGGARWRDYEGESDSEDEGSAGSQ